MRIVLSSTCLAIGNDSKRIKMKEALPSKTIWKLRFDAWIQ